MEFKSVITVLVTFLKNYLCSAAQHTVIYQQYKANMQKFTPSYIRVPEVDYLKTFPSATGLPPKSPSQSRYLLMVFLSSSLSGSILEKLYEGASIFQSSTS